MTLRVEKARLCQGGMSLALSDVMRASLLDSIHGHDSIIYSEGATMVLVSLLR